MKLLITILFSILCSNIGAIVYYVQDTAYNENASDSNAGTDINYPFATPQHAVNIAQAGDTVYFRGGVWYLTGRIYLDNKDGGSATGLPGNPISFFNYPEESPVFDFRNAVAPGNYPDNRYISGIAMMDVHFINFKGLTIRNVYQREEGVEAKGINGWAVSNINFENMIIYDISGPAYYIQGINRATVNAVEWWGWDTEIGYVPYDTMRFINCDSYNICDSLVRVVGLEDTGNRQGDGFKVVNYPGSYVSYENCRAWRCCDDGFDGKMDYVSNCWSFNNIYPERPDWEGNGFKWTMQGGLMDLEVDTVIRNNNKKVFTRNIAAFVNNAYQPIFYDTTYAKLGFYNNIAYDAKFGMLMGVYAAQDTFDIRMRNNVFTEIFGRDAVDRPEVLTLNYPYYESHNNWDYAESGSLPNWTYTDSVTVTDADFVMVDSVTAIAQMSAARKADGSLPDITFLTLAAGSDLIDAGTQIPESDSSGVILSFYGSAPDIGYAEYAQIIADHTVVDKYDDIPQQWIDSVKTMWLSIPGESHSFAYREGMWYLNGEDATYASNVTGSGTPETPTSSHLRVSSSTWGDLTNETGWIYSYGEEDWFTSAPAIARTKAGLTYANAISNPISAIGFGWCWDLGTSAPDYVQATKEYIAYTADSIPTTVFFTTGPVDTYTGEYGYNQYLKYETIRDSVSADPSRILFDYADILSYDYDGTTNTTTYGEYTYPIITTKNLGDGSIGHVSDTASVRLAKAMWWMLARIAGWDGLVLPEIDSTLHNILTFTLTAQTGTATIDITNHTVSIEVDYGTNITALQPTITVSEGATISPTSGTATNFTSPVVYTVTALDESTQEWTVTVTVAAAPEVPMGRIGQGSDRRVQQGSAIRIYL